MKFILTTYFYIIIRTLNIANLSLINRIILHLIKKLLNHYKKNLEIQLGPLSKSGILKWVLKSISLGQDVSDNLQQLDYMPSKTPSSQQIVPTITSDILIPKTTSHGLSHSLSTAPKTTGTEASVYLFL